MLKVRYRYLGPVNLDYTSDNQLEFMDVCSSESAGDIATKIANQYAAVFFLNIADTNICSYSSPCSTGYNSLYKVFPHEDSFGVPNLPIPIL